MRIIKQDYNQGIVRVNLTNQEDVWYLSQLIDPDNLVTSVTTRKIKIGDEENAKVTRKTMVLTIQAETVNIDETGLILRINGKVKNGPEDVPIDSYHALSLQEGSEVTIKKDNWLSYQKKQLLESIKEKSNYLICLIDREEAIFAKPKAFGYEIISKIKGDVQKKGRDVQIKKEFSKELNSILLEYDKRINPEHIILASPAFYKDEFLKTITDEKLKKKIVLVASSSVDEQAITEVMKKPELKKILQTNRIGEEKILVEELLSEINKDNLAVYGLNEVERAVNFGAVLKLIITNKYLQKVKVDGSFLKIDSLMKSVDKTQGHIFIISSENESGKTIDGLGGIAAILRYKLNY